MKNREFKYKSFTLKVSHNSADYEAVKFEAWRGAGDWDVVELFPDEVRDIASQIKGGKEASGSFDNNSDITVATKWRSNGKGLVIEQQSPEIDSTKHSIMIKVDHFLEVAAWIGSGTRRESVESDLENDVLRILSSRD